MRRAAQGANRGKEERRGRRKEEISSLYLPLALSKHRGRQMRGALAIASRGAVRVPRHACHTSVPSVGAVEERDPARRATEGEGRCGFGERNFEISTNGERYAEPRRLRARACRSRFDAKTGTAGLIPGTYIAYGDSLPPSLRNDGIFSVP